MYQNIKNNNIYNIFTVFDVDMCAMNPCLNGGTCEKVPYDFKCTCPQNTLGKTCEGKSHLNSAFWTFSNINVLKR